MSTAVNAMQCVVCVCAGMQSVSTSVQRAVTLSAGELPVEEILIQQVIESGERNGWVDGWVDGWMEVWIDEQMDEWFDEWMDKQMNRWMVVKMSRWMNGGLYGWIYE